MLKRAFDVAASLAGLALLSPLFLACALLVKLESKGPIFFRQRRVGLRGSTFRIHKFRTMTADAETVGNRLTAANDARVTKWGATLRRYKLDELPQLLDVLRGRMSIVGPRPEVAEFVGYYPPDIRDVVLSVRPGITDLASIHFRNESALLVAADNAEFYVREILPVKLRYYVDYVNQQSFWLDIKIIVLTFSVLFNSKRRVPSTGV